LKLAQLLYINSTDSISASFFLLTTQAKNPGRTLSRQYGNFKSKELRVIKDSMPSFAGFHSKREQTVSVQIEHQRIKATVLLHHVYMLILI